MRECEEYVRRVTGVSSRWPRLALLASQQINGPGDAVARALAISGPVRSVSSACASGGLAIGDALDAVRDGEVEVALTGGADSLCVVTYAGFNSLRSLDDRPCRPFRSDRAGLSIGEGAAVLVLERLERALDRGARPLAEILGSGASCDAHHMTAPHPDGVGAAAAMRAALMDANLTADAVTFVNAHGTGTPLNDLSESAACQDVFGDSAAAVPVTSSKGSVGHLLGCSGAIEAVATILDLDDGQVHVTPGNGALDPEIAVDVVLDQPRPIPRDAVALSTSFAFGGANAALVIASWQGEEGG
jgi:3-oxoacyl-[acyl-carrier-protein] synthase II